MRKKIINNYPTKADKREQKKRPRMRVRSRGLISQKVHAGKKLTAKR